MRRKNEVMSKNAFYRADSARMALEEMESYCATHPNSPSAARRPALSIRRGLWIALLGPSVAEGIVGIRSTVKEHFAPSACNTWLDDVSPSEFLDAG
jgi:hypothetical protein